MFFFISNTIKKTIDLQITAYFYSTPKQSCLFVEHTISDLGTLRLSVTDKMDFLLCILHLTNIYIFMYNIYFFITFFIDLLISKGLLSKLKLSVCKTKGILNISKRNQKMCSQDCGSIRHFKNRPFVNNKVEVHGPTF